MGPVRQPSISFPLRGPRASAIALAAAQALLVAAAGSWLVGHAPAVQAQPAEAQKSYAIPAGPLAGALNRFGREAGVMLSFSSEQTHGLQSQGLSGSHSVQGGLRALLAGTGLEAVAQANGGYVLRKEVEQPPASAPHASRESESTLPAVQVTAARSPETATGPVRGYVARRSAVATKTDTPIAETPQSISVVTRDQMTAQNAQSVSDALRYSAGVLAESNGPDPRADVIVVRGFDTGMRDSFRDGLRSYAFNNQGGTVFEPYGLERIEVLRGPSSILYGQGGAGGLVNLVSKRPTTETLRQVQAQLGSEGRKQLAGDFGGSLTQDGEWSYRLTGLVRESGTFIDHVQDDRGYLAAALTWQPSAATSVTWLADHQRNERGQGYQALPRIGTLEANPNGDIASSRFLGEPGFDKFNQSRTSIGYLFEHRIGEQVTLRQNLRHQRMDSDVNTIYMIGLKSDNRTVGRFGSQGEEEVTNTVVDSQVQLKWQHGVVEHTTLLGFDVQRMRNETRASYGAFGDLDVYAPVYGQSTATLTLGDDTRQRLRQTGIYVQDQIKIDKTWVATLGARRDRVTLTTDDRLAGSTTSSKDGATTSRAGLVYLAPMGWAPYISYSESFVPVAGLDFESKPFKPETGRQREIGVRYQPVGTGLSVTASVFDLARQNVTTADLAHVGETTQRGEVTSRGFEIEAKANLRQGWDLIGNYAQGRVRLSKNNDGNEGNEVSSVPRVMASAWVLYTAPDGAFAGLGLGLGARHIGTTFNDDANTSRTPSYTLADLVVRYDLSRLGAGWEGWRAAFNVSNLFDKKYVATCGYYGDGCKYGYRRNAMLTMTYDW